MSMDVLCGSRTRFVLWAEVLASVFPFSLTAPAAPSLPRPWPAPSTLLLVPLETVQTGGGRPFGTYELSLREVDECIRLQPRCGRFSALRRLPPGRYTITGCHFLFNRHRGREVPLELSFSLRWGSVSLLRHCFVLHCSREGGNTWQSWQIRELSGSEVEALWRDLGTWTNFELWKRGRE